LPNGQTQDLSGKQKVGIVGKFARGKMTPLAGFAFDYAQGENSFTRKPVAITDAPKALLLPLSMNEIEQGLKQDGSIALLTRFIPSFVGLKVSDSRDFADTGKVPKTPETEWMTSKGQKISVTSPKQLNLKDKEGKDILPSEEEYKKYLDLRNEIVIKAIKKFKEGKGFPMPMSLDPAKYGSDQYHTVYAEGEKPATPEELKYFLSVITKAANEDAKKKIFNQAEAVEVKGLSTDQNLYLNR
jgi:hypothetical protein